MKNLSRPNFLISGSAVIGLTVVSLFFAACGRINGKGSTGGSLTLNEAAPSGTLAASGSFQGMNSQSVSGVAKIYKLDEDQGYVLRLEGLVSPTTVTLQVALKTTASSTAVYTTTLKAPLGNQNYVTGITGTQTWDSVTLQLPSKIPPEYGTALLTVSLGQ